PAAMRYTEARLNRMAEEMLADIEKNTVDFSDNFDGSLQEPVVLPAQLPNLLLNGSSGIAVGMATNIPPHNLQEVISALSYVIDNFDQIDEITTEDLLEHIQGPDFPTGGMIVGMEGIRQAYSSGRGRIVMRGLAHIEETNGGRHRIVVTEIPYQLNKTTLIERIADLAREGKLDQISDLRDESDRRGLSIIIELKRTAQPLKVLNQLYKYTPLQTTYGVQLLALVDGEPRLLSIKRALQIFVHHRQDVIIRRSEYELEKARSRAHILEGLLKALDKIDEVIQTIRQSPDVETARGRLMSGFELSELQAQAILDMQLRRLAALERKKIEDEYKEVKQEISYLEDLLSSQAKILALIKEDLQDIAEAYGDERRTRIAADASGDLNEEDLVQDEAILISITQRGYIKRVAAQVYRSQGRGGRGVKGHTTRDQDEVTLLIPARSLDSILFFSNRGKVYSEKAYQIPDEKRTGKGISIVNVLPLNPGEMVTAAVAVPDFAAAEYCIMATRSGRVKRVILSEFASVRPSGLIAMNLADDDELVWVRPTNGEQEMIWVTEQGQALRFKEDKVRAMGRQAAGVLGIRLRPGDRVAGMEVIEPDSELLVVTVNGFGKRTPVSEYPPKGRATYGVQTIDKKVLDSLGIITSARIVTPGDDLTLISAGGVILRTNVDNISRQGRATRGVRVMNLDEGDHVATVARIEARLFEEPEENGGEAPPETQAASPNGSEGD
ncbi:MAG: DNA gyrase subunit A, partial [Anaerolineales bacterium]|nr:DNA gyrase subunit A [Anaerolineales bacterium]